MKIIECPRDAMQGLHQFIPTKVKANYINWLLKVGFDTIDFGSFVSPKAIPQMKDTAEVLSYLDLSDTKSKLLAIVANRRGAEEAVGFQEITYLGYPLSLSETFQQRNTNRSITQALQDLSGIQDLCLKNDKILVTYLSMGFGNPYGDPYDEGYIETFVKKLDDLDVRIISLADTIGISIPENIKFLFENVIPKFPHIEFGAHLHARPDQVVEKLSIAYKAGCRRFDGAIKGLGGCPMAEDQLVGNMTTEIMVNYFNEKNIALSINENALLEALELASIVFPAE